MITFTLPIPSYTKGFVYSNLVSYDRGGGPETEHLVSLDRCSSINKLARVREKVLLFSNGLKHRLKSKYPGKYDNLKVENNDNLYQEACRQILITG